MYLIDTDVISESRKGQAANPGVVAFFSEAHVARTALFLSVVTVGEIRHGVERMRQRGDEPQSQRLERWLNALLDHFSDHILPFDADCAQMWGRLRVPDATNPLDKQIGATALIHSLTVVTRNVAHFRVCGVPAYSPFSGG
jgi:predicted nucleic acid-binding protein